MACAAPAMQAVLLGLGTGSAAVSRTWQNLVPTAWLNVRLFFLQDLEQESDVQQPNVASTSVGHGVFWLWVLHPEFGPRGMVCKLQAAAAVGWRACARSAYLALPLFHGMQLTSDAQLSKHAAVWGVLITAQHTCTGQRR